MGYKEGLDEGKAQTIQEGFDEGAFAVGLAIISPRPLVRSLSAWACDRVQVRDKHGVPAGDDQREGGNAQCAATYRRKEQAIMTLLRAR